MLEILKQLTASVERNEPAALATVVEVVGASPAKVGAKILVRGDGATIGTAGGGRLEQAIVADARAALAGWRTRMTESKRPPGL
jgi:xanthine dehydrogenase accessory factor